LERVVSKPVPVRNEVFKLSDERLKNLKDTPLKKKLMKTLDAYGKR
jgi:hypothetical protein